MAASSISAARRAAAATAHRPSCPPPLRSPSCAVCPRGYSPNADGTKCLRMRCPKPTIRVDTDGNDNGLVCC
jgi:hypothetical protein